MRDRKQEPGSIGKICIETKLSLHGNGQFPRNGQSQSKTRFSCVIRQSMEGVKN
jgi:hypothetical protein